MKEFERCLRCGRKLKNPEYRLTGYGKICAEKMKHSVTKKPLFNTEEVLDHGEFNKVPET